MKNIFKFQKTFFSIILSVLASVFLVSVVVFAASTIDLNISTGGTLTVSGTSTVSGVSNTGYITTSGNLNVSKSGTIIDWLLVGTSSRSAKLHVDSYAGNAGMVTYAGPPSQNFSSNLQTSIDSAAHNFTVLNSASVSRDSALNGINQDNSSSDSFGVYGFVEATHTSGTKNQVVGVVGNVTNSGSSNVNILSGVLGVSQQEGAGTVSNLSSFYAGANSKSAGTVTNNYGLYISNEAGVGTNNYQIYSAGQLPFVVLPNANVGIGTSSPYLPLSVAGKAIFDSFKATNTSVASEIYGTLSISGNGTSTVVGGFNVSGGSIYEQGARVCTSTNGVCSVAGGTINTGTANYLAYYLNSSTIDDVSFLSIDTTNNRLGIGTSTPGTALSVTGAGVFTGPVTFPYFFATSTSATSTIVGSLIIDNGGFIYDTYLNRVGIGTTSPDDFDTSSLNIGLDVASGGISLVNNSSLSFGYSGNSNKYPVVQVTSGNALNIGDIGNMFGTVNFHAGGSSRAYLTNAGYFSLASTTPGAMLAVDNGNNYAGLIVSDQSGDTTPFIVDASGNVGIGTPVPQTKLEVNGTASTTGLVVGGGSTIQRIISNTASLDFSAIAPHGCEVSTITVYGAADGDPVLLGVPETFAGASSTIFWNGWVSTANIVSVRACQNGTATTTDPASATFRATVLKF